MSGISKDIVVWTITLSEKDYDIRDYLVNDVLEWLDNIEKEKSIMRPISKTVYQNWWWSCTAAATTNSMKSQNEKEYWKELEFNWKELWSDMWHDLSDKNDRWDRLIKAIKTALSNWINWYKADAYAYWRWDIREKALHIAPLTTVICGTSKTWAEMTVWEIKTIIPYSDKTWCHAITICWYDRNYVYFYNSFADYIVKNWISTFKIKRELFYEMMKVNMLNWRWFWLYDKKDLKDYTKEIEKSKEIIKLSKALYELWDNETKEYFEKIGITNYLENKYWFNY